MNDKLTTADKIAMVVGGGLIMLGTLVMGLFETIIGNPHVMEQTNEAGDVIAHTTFDPNLRAFLIAAGLLVWGLYVVYRLAAPRVNVGTETTRPGTAD